MSAYVVSKRHIDALVSALIEFDVYVQIDGDRPQSAKHIDPNAIGRMLWTENVRSVTDRYNLAVTQDPSRQDEHADYIDSIVNYTFKRCHSFRAGPLAHAVACYEYQSCEHDGWKDSAAHDAIVRLYKALCRKLPGYEDGPWGIDNDEDLAKVCDTAGVSLSSLARRRK